MSTGLTRTELSRIRAEDPGTVLARAAHGFLADDPPDRRCGNGCGLSHAAVVAGGVGHCRAAPDGAPRWRVFIGRLRADRGWTILDVVLDDWQHGRDVLVGRLRQVAADDPCAVCQDQAGQAVAVFLAADRFTAVQALVEDEQYTLVPVGPR